MAARRSALLCAGASYIVLSGAAYAQTASGPPDTPTATQNSRPGSPTVAQELPVQVPEVVVTANKRKENAQQVSATVATATQDELIRQGVNQISDISLVIPEVSISPGPLSVLNIRGVGSLGPGPTLESPNAFNVDGVNISRFTSLQALFFDTQRIEVLEGPQGTLYGRNAAGGELNVIANRPSQTFGGYGSLDYGNYNEVNSNAAINIPITDTLATRFAYFHNSVDSYYNNGLGAQDQNSFRASALWKPTSKDTIYISADREAVGGSTRLLAGGPLITSVQKEPTVLVNAAPSIGPMGPIPAGSVSLVPAGTPGGVVTPIKLSQNDQDSRTAVGDLNQNGQHDNAGGFQLEYTHDLGWATLTAQFAYRFDHYDNINGSTTGLEQAPALLTTGVDQYQNPNFFETGNDQENTQEIRLTSPGHQMITYVAGLYRFHERSYGDQLGYDLTEYPNAPGQIGQFIIPTPLVPNLDIGNSVLVDEADAAFGQATYTPTFFTRLHITGGLRYNFETKHGIGFTILNTMPQPAGSFDDRLTSHNVSYKANVSYDVTPNNLVYFDNSTGFSAGGFGYGVDPEYKPTTIQAYEIGSKNGFFHNRVIFNVSAWHYNYNDLVAQTVDYYLNTQTGFPGVSPTVTNAEKAHIDGQTVTTVARPTPNDTISLSFTHTYARYVDFNLVGFNQVALQAGFIPGATAQDFVYNGSRIGLSPDWAGNFSLDHIFHVLSGELDTQFVTHYTGRILLVGQIAAADHNDDFESLPLVSFDISASYKPRNAPWSLTAYVHNMTDARVANAETYSSNASFLPTSDPRVLYGYTSEALTPPRLFGFIASYQF